MGIEQNTQSVIAASSSFFSERMGWKIWWCLLATSWEMTHEFSRPGTQRESHPGAGSSQKLKNHGPVHASGNFAFDIGETSISPMSFGIPVGAARTRVSISDALRASQLHNIPTGTSFGTAVLAANEMEAKDTIACPGMSSLASGTGLQVNPFMHGL